MLIPNTKVKKVQPEQGEMTVQKSLKETLHQFNQRKAEKLLASSFATSSAAVNFVENKWLAKFFRSLNSAFVVPSRYGLFKCIDELCKNVETKIASSIKRAQAVSICLDIWSKKDMTSYLGVTCHFYDSTIKAIRVCAIGLEKLEGRHTAEKIFEMFDEVKQKWGITNENILKVVTDNGSNVVKAFKDMAEFEKAACEEDGLEREEVDPNLDLSFDEELSDFDDAHFGLLRLPCFAHSFQLLVKYILKNCSQRQSLNCALTLIHRLQKSTIATEYFLEKAKKKLISLCVTRWNTVYFVIERFLEMKDVVIACVDNLKWDGLLQSQWTDLEQLEKILAPLAQFSEDLASQNKPTLSLVLPYLFMAETHLKKVLFEPFKTDVLVEYRRRFEFVTNSVAMQFDPAYASATLLDPRFMATFTIDRKFEPLKQAAIIYIHKLAYKLEENEEQIEAEGASCSSSMEVSEAPTSLFDLFISQLERGAAKTPPAARTSPLDVELSRYASEIMLAPDTDVFRFWCLNQHTYEKLSVIACNLLSVPASSAFVERAFSAAGFSCLGRRNRLKDTNLKNIALLKMNQHFIEI